MTAELTPRVYFACLAAYNNGHLHGKWIDANQDADTIREEVAEMLKASPIPQAEEWAMPGLAGTMNPSTCTCYEHLGQHSSADLAGCIRSSRLATPEESAPLLRELQQVGYIVNPVRNATRRHFEARVKQL